MNSEFLVKTIDIPEYTLGYGEDESSKLKITLKKIAEIPFGGFRNPLREQAFSLHFTAGQELPQGTYHLAHETLGELEMFLVAHGPGEDGFQLVATFN